MEATFEPTRALLRECLEYPGQSYETLRRVVGASVASMISGWLDGRATPKRPRDWPTFHRKLEAHRQQLERHGADPTRCDDHWKDRFEAYCRSEGVTPEAFAKRVGASEWHGVRWHRWGEVPIDRARSAVIKATGYDFDAAVFPRAHAAATQQFGRSLPAPLDHAETAQALHDAIGEIRQRSGLTIAALAKRARVRESQLAELGSRPVATQQLNRPTSIAAVIVGLARYVTAHPERFDASSESGAPAAIARAREILERRPARPKGSVKGRTTVHWDRIEKYFTRRGTHRFFGYRCPNGEFAAVVFVRLCIAYEQSRLTTNDASQRTGINTSRLSTWLNGRSLPDFPMLEQLQQAVERLEGRATSAALARASSAEPVATPAAASVAPVPSAVAPATPAPTDGAADILVGMASTARGLRAMHRAGWRPDGTAREHLIAITKTAMEVGGLTSADLQPKLMTAAPDGRSPAVEAFREIAPNLRSRSDLGGGTRRP